MFLKEFYFRNSGLIKKNPNQAGLDSRHDPGFHGGLPFQISSTEQNCSAGTSVRGS